MPAARALGSRLGEAVAKAIAEGCTGDGARAGTAPSIAGRADMDMAIHAEFSAVKVPLDPLPSAEAAQQFVEEQRGWLANMKGAKAAELPATTKAYAERVLAAVKAGSQGDAYATVGVAALALNQTVAIVGIEAEPFSDYALHLQNASPFPVTITVGYANGCRGYLPTEAEVPYGGYEVVHAHVPYLRAAAIPAEHHVVSAAIGLSASATLRSPAGRNAPGCEFLAAESFDSRFPRRTIRTTRSASPPRRGMCYVLGAEPADARLLRAARDGRGARRRASAQAPQRHRARLPGPAEGRRRARSPTSGRAATRRIVRAGQGARATAGGPERPVALSLDVGLLTEVDGGDAPCVVGRHLGDPPARAQAGGRPGALTPVARPRREGVMRWPPTSPATGSSASRGRVANSAWSESRRAPTRGRMRCAYSITRVAATAAACTHAPGRYRPVCRSMAVDPRTGRLYLSNTAGDILEYDPHSRGPVRAVLSGADGLCDYFGQYDVTAPGSMGYHWRQMQWVEDARGDTCSACTATPATSSSSARLLPPRPASWQASSLVLHERLTSRPSRRVGMGDQFSYGYLGFAVHRGVAYYLTGAPIYTADGARLAGEPATNKGDEASSTPPRRVRPRGRALRRPRARLLREPPRRRTSLIAVGGGGFVYALGRMRTVSPTFSVCPTRTSVSGQQPLCRWMAREGVLAWPGSLFRSCFAPRALRRWVVLFALSLGLAIRVILCEV